MTLLAAVGQARALDGREAGMQATHQALNNLGNTPPVLGLVISSYLYDAPQVVNGVASLIGTTPIIGFSTPAGMTSDGIQPHSVVVALLASDDIRADVTWLAGYTQGSREVSMQLAELLKTNPKQPALFFADGFNADAEQLCASLPTGTNLIGALSSGDLHTGNAYQIGGSQFGAGGLALSRLEGNIHAGVGYGHGWQRVGTHFRVTRSRGFWVRTLDGRPASEAYAHLFGYPARDWAFPPLDHLARLYPLGLEQLDKSLVLRSPLRIEADGSFRMNATVGDGTEAYMLVGSLTACQQAATTAVEQAIAGLQGARPVLALVLADIAWQMLFEAEPGADIAAVQAALGANIPIVGGYTLGQVVPNGAFAPQFLNQHLVVVVFGEE
ncbi:MAG TPA: FIST N-terminal domain-containing protein [Anaerolineales bacterium]|nr:FIST N-terminal domain-containing protein [Anaerolineales bacterium]